MTPPLEWSEEQDELIRLMYGKSHTPIQELLKHPLFSFRNMEQIRGRARKLGVKSRFVVTEPEMVILARHAGNRSILDIQRLLKDAGFTRSRSTIETVVARLVRSTKPDLYSATELAFLCGTDKKRVIRWLHTGRLIGRKDGSVSSQWRVKPVDVALFFRQYPFLLVHTRPDIPWLIALMEETWTDTSRRLNAKHPKHDEESCNQLQSVLGLT